MKEVSDIRETADFQDFKNDVLQFILESKRVSWRMLNEKFYSCHYWISLAVEDLNGGQIIWEKEKIPEVIKIKDEVKTEVKESKLNELEIEKHAANGLNKTQAAKEIGISATYFGIATTKNEKFKKAWERGLAKRVLLQRKPDDHFAPKTDIVPSNIKIEVEVPEPANASVVSPDMQNLLRKIRAEFVYQEAWNEPSPHRSELIEVIGRLV